MMDTDNKFANDNDLCICFFFLTGSLNSNSNMCLIKYKKKIQKVYILEYFFVFPIINKDDR